MASCTLPWWSSNTASLSINLQRVNNHRPLRIEWLRNSRCLPQARSNARHESSLEQHSTGFHMQSLTFSPLCRGCWVQNLQVWYCYCGPAKGSLVSGLCERHQAYGYTQFPKGSMHTFYRLPLLSDAYFWQCAGIAHHLNNTPLSGINNRCSQSSKAITIITHTLLTSYSWTTFGCLTFFKIVISLFILSRSAWSLIFSFSRIFMATYKVA